MPTETGETRYLVKIPREKAIGPLDAERITELYAKGGLPDTSEVRRLPDGAWLPILTVFHHLETPVNRTLGSAAPSPVARKAGKERRHGASFTLVDRRKSRAWMLGEIAVLAVLLLVLALISL
ncbi:MAG TPA: hypothetical protein VGR00_04870 [Thermoanaerobaculia bacterium]|jgi:hypothetical protein|nr:hypothetical protein [Thermoanaerobaculia bacterium]